jgi:hypothetical protein
MRVREALAFDLALDLAFVMALLPFIGWSSAWTTRL